PAQLEMLRMAGQGAPDVRDEVDLLRFLDVAKDALNDRIGAVFVDELDGWHGCSSCGWLAVFLCRALTSDPRRPCVNCSNATRTRGGSQMVAGGWGRRHRRKRRRRFDATPAGVEA